MKVSVEVQDLIGLDPDKLFEDVSAELQAHVRKEVRKRLREDPAVAQVIARLTRLTIHRLLEELESEQKKAGEDNG